MRRADLGFTTSGWMVTTAIVAFYLSSLQGCPILGGEVPVAEPATDRVDMIEENRVYDGDGNETLHQFIGWDWDVRDCRWKCVFWRLASKMPKVSKGEKGYQLLWWDGETLRLVHAPVYYRSWKQSDPEIANRRLYPEYTRRALSSGKESKTLPRRPIPPRP